MNGSDEDFKKIAVSAASLRAVEVDAEGWKKSFNNLPPTKEAANLKSVVDPDHYKQHPSGVECIEINFFTREIIFFTPFYQFF